MSDFPFTLLMVAVPAAGAAVTGAMRHAPAKTVKTMALAFSLATFAIGVALWIGFTPGAPGFQYVSTAQWIPTLGLNFSVGVDGVSLVMIALIALLVPIVLGASWEEKLPPGRSIGSYFALLLMLESLMIGVFAATDVFLFYVFFELMLIPMYFLIGAYGGPRRTYAATKFFLYSLFGGLMMLASVIGLYVVSRDHVPGGTLDWETLRGIASQIPESTQMWIFAGFAIAFAIKAPLVPFHTWLPDAGAEAPVGSGTLIVGVLDKVGTFGFLRICLPLLPAASSKLAWLIITLAVIGIFYGGIVAAGQRDLKRFVTYTSIAHFGFIAMGVFAFSSQAMSGAVIYMVAHGLATGLLFLVVGMLTSRGNSRLISDYGGVWKVAPILGGMFLIGSLATIALPGTSSFVAEFLVLLGTFSTQPAWAIAATVGIVIAAVYMLWIFQRTMTGPIRGAGVLGSPADAAVAEGDFGVGSGSAGSGSSSVALGHKTIFRTPTKFRFGDLNIREIAVLTPLVLLIVVIGVYPKPLLDVINPVSAQIIVDSGHSDPAPSIEGGK
ncbi:NADH-quinone oxidoreductase subunit M [Nakamurella antarctica]|uniref:NADH-quinone oxidoreductase subunit M n=1 Tax=Nakamurella antarctica TaxID=1902245 RepID=A0A3G8ZWC5_9ACTN|nr:NADH-quinone oxidoreductase subunit M [Nakamurella antarctica]AZI58734.1 NADH-quinone oxidoreductase subunit M [Nakamurella antarctica]